MSHIAADLGKITTQFGVQNSYGEPQDLDGEKFVPVSVVWSGFGAGSDDGRVGGGGGGMSAPIGSYVRRAGVLRFEPNLIALLAVSIPLVCVTGRALKQVIRALKK